ncbi:MAG TPA: ABC transporter substrate-binding protein [Stellaceae bacterium]|nr:ABC transporter substrate-binding protein [Stellaceae bacterium]
MAQRNGKGTAAWRRALTIRMLLLAAACAGALAQAAVADPVTLRVGWVVSTADAPLLMFGKAGLARHEGVTYKLDPIHFQGSPPMITALAAGEVDLVGLGFSTVPTAVLNAGMTDLRIIADQFQDGVPGYYSNEFMVLKDGPIHTIDDMKGHIAADNATGSAIDMALRAMLKKHGLEDKRNVTIIEAPFPAMPAMLTDHKVDLIAALRTFTADPAVLAYSRPLFTQGEAMGRSQMGLLAARAPFLEKNRAAVVDYLEDELRELRWYSDPANHDEVVQIIATFSKVPPAALARWIYIPKEDLYHDPQGLPDLDALQSNIELQRDLGFLKSDLDVRKLADLSYVKEAAQRLK